MTQKTQRLHESFDILSEEGYFEEYSEIPRFLEENLNPQFKLRPYQKEAFARYFYYMDQYKRKQKPYHLLFNMATGSGKTLIMAGLILYLYEKGYRNFLFFVNSKNIIEKTKDNFLNTISSKYLFSDKILFDNKHIEVKNVSNFADVNVQDINICFTTIQQLHTDINQEKEDCITVEDFKDKKIVFLSDESHHNQTTTKQKRLNHNEEKHNWENTVIKLFRANQENILLEFTATMDFMNKAIEAKYFGKIIYKYDLKQFRSDKYSKDVYIMKADIGNSDRILTSIILNQYRQDIAVKHNISLKPVILFKAQKTIADSHENEKKFHEVIDNLTVEDIIRIKKRIDIPEIQKAFKFYDDKGDSLFILVQKIKKNFSEEKCLSVNKVDEQGKYQNKVNSLEDEDNNIRVIFALHKLTEGWDVLNLFDIVRLYQRNTVSSTKKPQKTTIAEAQLIGRGARYFPFEVEGLDKDKYKRKFDNDAENELQILESLHFHSPNESGYIQELNKALEEEGIIDAEKIEKKLTIKDEFKQTELYKEGVVFGNEKEKISYEDVTSFRSLDMDIPSEFKYDLYSGKGTSTRALDDDVFQQNYTITKKTQTVKFSEIPKHVVLSALARNAFFTFDNISKYCHNINSIHDLIERNEYLGNFEIEISGVEEDLANLSNKQRFQAVLSVLSEIEEIIKRERTDYKGTKKLVRKKISAVFTNRTVKVEKNQEKAEGMPELQDKTWYAYDNFYGTDQERECMKLLTDLIENKLNENYTDIYIIRNERQLKLYNFKDGKGFEPDFVMFMKDKHGNDLSYQIFIEPKGGHLEEKDKWKEKELLLKLEGIQLDESLEKYTKNRNYKVVGLPFYNIAKEKEFREAFENKFLKDMNK